MTNNLLLTKIKLKKAYNNFILMLLGKDVREAFQNLNNMLYDDKIYILNRRVKNKKLKIKKTKNMKVYI